MKMCELKDGDCFYVPYGDWYGHVFDKNGVLYYHVNFNEREWLLGDCDTEVEKRRPDIDNIEWKLKQLGFKLSNKYDDCNRKILTIDGNEYEVYVDYRFISALSFYVPCSMHLGCEENTFTTSGLVNHLNNIDGLYHAFVTMCKQLAEYDLISEYEEE